MLKFDTLVEGKYLFGELFSSFENLSFLGPRDPFFPKTLEQPSEVKNGPIMLKLGKIVG